METWEEAEKRVVEEEGSGFCQHEGLECEMQVICSESCTCKACLAAIRSLDGGESYGDPGTETKKL